MKNRLIQILAVALISFGFVACTEKVPTGLNLEPSAFEKDSVYEASIETPQGRNVLIEELTGVNCANCPNGAATIKTIGDNYPERVVAVGLHPFGEPFCEPLSTSKYDFRTEDANKIRNNLSGGAFPGATIVRKEIIGGNFPYFTSNRGSWSTMVDEEIVKSTPVNLHLTSSYNTDGNQCDVQLRMAFTEVMSEKLNVTIYVVENDIVDYQVDGSVKIPDYNHKHVFRDCITNVIGNPLNENEMGAGKVQQKTIRFNPTIEGTNKWNLDNCYIVAFVSRVGSSREVLHAQEVKLK